jgi:steroid 5-alpha reductase family enzyme
MILDILNSWTMTAVFITAVWGFYLWKKTPGIIDVAWSFGIMLLAFWHAHLQTPLHKVTLFLIIVWALRLSGYLFITRILKGEKDNRYLSLQKNWQAINLTYWLNYQFQGVLQILLSLGFYFIFADLAPITPLSIVAIIIIVTGFIGEITADTQLTQFKKDITNKGQVCNVGLWKLSRHPNYFFEWLIWVGFAVLSQGSHLGWLAWIAPITLYIIMNHVTGPLTEKQSILSRGDRYKDYMAKTPMFFPKLPYGA